MYTYFHLGGMNFLTLGICCASKRLNFGFTKSGMAEKYILCSVQCGKDGKSVCLAGRVRSELLCSFSLCASLASERNYTQLEVSRDESSEYNKQL